MFGVLPMRIAAELVVWKSVCRARTYWAVGGGGSFERWSEVGTSRIIFYVFNYPHQ